MEYKLIRSSRKTFALELRPEGMIVRVPYRASNTDINKFIESHRAWIEKHQPKVEKRREEIKNASRLSAEELHALADQALKVIPRRVAYYAPKVGVTYGRITIRNQKTRWGSCSSAGNLNFNCLLMLTPPEVIDSVVVHELCHRLEMNHSPRFYEEVLRVYPEYHKWNQWLKQNGRGIMDRMRVQP